MSEFSQSYPAALKVRKSYSLAAPESRLMQDRKPPDVKAGSISRRDIIGERTMPHVGSLDDLELIVSPPSSSRDVRLLYRSWRTGASQGADLSSFEKHFGVPTTTSQASSKSSDDVFSITMSPPKTKKTDGVKSDEEMPLFSSSLEHIFGMEDHGYGIGMDLGDTSLRIPEFHAPSYTGTHAAATTTISTPKASEFLDEMEKRSQKLSLMFQNQNSDNSMNTPAQPRQLVLSSSLSTSAEKYLCEMNFMGRLRRKTLEETNECIPTTDVPPQITPSLKLSVVTASKALDVPLRSSKADKPMSKSMSYTVMSDLEKTEYFPFMPKLQETTSALGIQRSLKDSVTNDMCRAIVTQMVGELYIVSTVSRGSQKIVNHLYEPLLKSVKSHFKRLPARYALSVNPDDVPMHMRLLAQAERNSEVVAIHAQWYKHDEKCQSLDDEICEIVVVTSDQDLLLDAITHSISNLKGKIIDADVMTTKNGIALDRFIVRGNFVADARLLEVKNLVEKLLSFTPAKVLSNVQVAGTAVKENAKNNDRLTQLIQSHEGVIQQEWTISMSELKLERSIGIGRSGSTYCAQWRGTVVAAKVIQLKPFKDTLSDELLAEFYREVALVSRLRHPNIVLFLGAAIDPPKYVLVFEYMDAGTLTDVIRVKKKPLNFFKIAYDLALGMNYLHHCSIIHRDLKSSNVLLDKSGSAKVSDFGLSCVFELVPGATEVNDLTAETGTYRWMAPEVIRHEPYSNKADMYSYGVMLWEMITKDQPFRGMTPIQAAFAVARQKMRPALPAYTPPKLAELVEHCWHQDPRMRPTFSELLDVLPTVQSLLQKRDLLKLNFI